MWGIRPSIDAEATGSGKCPMLAAALCSIAGLDTRPWPSIWATVNKQGPGLPNLCDEVLLSLYLPCHHQPGLGKDAYNEAACRTVHGARTLSCHWAGEWICCPVSHLTECQIRRTKKCPKSFLHGLLFEMPHLQGFFFNWTVVGKPSLSSYYKGWNQRDWMDGVCLEGWGASSVFQPIFLPYFFIASFWQMSSTFP